MNRRSSCFRPGRTRRFGLLALRGPRAGEACSCPRRRAGRLVLHAQRVLGLHALRVFGLHALRVLGLHALQVLGMLALFACGSGSAPTRTVMLHLPAGAAPDLAKVRFEPAAAVRGVRAGHRGWLAIECTLGALRMHVPGLCPVTIPAGTPVTPLTQSATGPARFATQSSKLVEVAALFDIGPDRAQLGFDAPFELDVHAGCAEAERGAIEWRQVEGPRLEQLEITERGWRVHGRTLPLTALRPEPMPHGIVPFSPRTQGRYVLEARFRDAAGQTLVKRLTLTSTARASGVPSVAVSQRLELGGSGWRVREPARAGRAQVLDAGEHASFTPDAPGRWVLEDGAAQRLTLQAAWHDKTPLDCGRAECHPAAAEAVLDSPMSHALERQLQRGGDGLEAITCTFDCHVVGERGLHDGGFLDVAAALDWRWQAGLRWQDLPQPMRRLGGVRCTSCHGPGAIPEPGARAAILTSDVCAVCHDAPPRYLHVAAWRSSRMARADAPSATRAEPCARCHTTAGFLEAIGVRQHGDEPRAGGLACAACHAPHAARHDGALLRSVPLPDALASDAGLPELAVDARTKLCANCHAPLALQPLPAASAAALWAGRVRVPDAAEPGRWQLVDGPAPHAANGGSCTTCHGAAANNTSASGTDHSFRANPASCASCHPADVSREPSAASALRAQALELARRLPRTCSSMFDAGTTEQPLHAQTKKQACARPADERARYELALVLEDPAVWVHNAPFARQLLADARAQLATVQAATAARSRR